MTGLRDRLERYMSGEAMEPGAGAATVRLAFAALFAAQVALALLVGFAVAVLTPDQAGATGLLGIVLVVLSVLQGPAGTAAGLAPLPEEEQARTAALQRALLAAVLLSTPAWYLAFLVVVGGGGWPVFAILGLLAVYWLVGVLLASRLGIRATAS